MRDTSRPHAGRVAPPPIVIAHRGASGYRPEHTLAAYRLAIEQGADFIEPDLVSSADGVLVARHENELGRTTDIADRPAFAARRTTKAVDGVEVTGWFAEDLTFAELCTLRAVERMPQVRPANTLYDGRFRIPSLSQVLALAFAAGRRLGRPIGVYTEAKSPAYFRSIGLPLEDALVRTLEAAGCTRREDPVVLQSFDRSSLHRLAGRTGLRLVQLLDDDPVSDAMAAADGLREVAGYAWAVGPGKERVLPRRADGSIAAASAFVGDAHAAGLRVHPWTFRAESAFLPRGLTARGELRAFLDAGVDGVFTDQPDIAVAALRRERRAVA